MNQKIERPVAPNELNLEWGSDRFAMMLRLLKLPYVCLTPGASFRGFHDSLVNALGNFDPQMILCLHEEHAVHIAQGYAKVTNEPLAVVLHSNIGLMHASMAIYNLWCDRLPALILGATGPLDAMRRRPYVDWIHTSRDQAALIRHYTKWDDIPGSVAAGEESLLRAYLIAKTAPWGPTYVCMDAGLQETRVPAAAALPDPSRYSAPRAPVPEQSLIEHAAQTLVRAKRPLIAMGRLSRNPERWNQRIKLAEHLGACVLTDLRTAATFPTDHPLHGAPAGLLPRPQALARVREADVVLSLDWVDLGGLILQSWPEEPCPATVIHISLDQFVHNGWSMDHMGLAPIDQFLLGDPDATLPALLDAVLKHPPKLSTVEPAPSTQDFEADPNNIIIPELASALSFVTRGQQVSILRLPSGWDGHLWKFKHPLDYLGCDAGGGLAASPGIAVGAALALKGSGRLPIAVMGDGDFMMGSSALWTAAHYNIPVMIIVANNSSYFNDEIHQERVARQRKRPVENRWIGQRLSDPDIDFAKIAEAQGFVGIGPVSDPAELVSKLKEAVEVLKGGQPVLVDVRIKPGYGFTIEKSITRDRED